MSKSKDKKTTDFNQIAKSIVEVATGKYEKIKQENPPPKIKKAKD